MIIDSFIDFLEHNGTLLSLLGDNGIVFGIVQSESLGKTAPYIEINQVSDSADNYSTGDTYTRFARVPYAVIGQNVKQAVSVWKVFAEEVEGQAFVGADSRVMRVRFPEYTVAGFDSNRGSVIGTVEIWYHKEISNP